MARISTNKGLKYMNINYVFFSCVISGTPIVKGVQLMQTYKNIFYTRNDWAKTILPEIGA